VKQNDNRLLEIGITSSRVKLNDDGRSARFQINSADGFIGIRTEELAFDRRYEHLFVVFLLIQYQPWEWWVPAESLRLITYGTSVPWATAFGPTERSGS
jgi:hypothetical protein